MYIIHLFFFVGEREDLMLGPSTKRVSSNLSFNLKEEKGAPAHVVATKFNKYDETSKGFGGGMSLLRYFYKT